MTCFGHFFFFSGVVRTDCAARNVRFTQYVGGAKEEGS